jgi:hypothetical protein
MKKSILLFSLLFIGILSLSACQWGGTDTADKTNDVPIVTQPANSEADMKSLGTEILSLLKNKDFEQLSLKIHPVQGVRFSPYAYVSTDDIHFTADDFLQMIKGDEKFLWGYADGSGFDLNLSFNEYYQRYIFDRDFSQAPKTAIDKRIKFGNTIENTLEFYPDAHFIEYHFPMFEAQYEGLDWKSLRLVFSEYEGQWYLIGVIHDEWTI